MNQGALSFAEQQRKLLTEQLNKYYADLDAANVAAQQAAAARKQSLLDVIAGQEKGVESAYQTGARESYVGKELGRQTLGQALGRMGLSTTGYGAGQQVALETALGKQLATLGAQKAASMTELGTQRLGAESAYGQELANLAQQYATNKMNLGMTIEEQGRAAQQQAYENYINEQQRQFENTLAIQAAGGTTGGITGGITGKAVTYKDQPIPLEYYGSGMTGVLTSDGKTYKYTVPGTNTSYTLGIGINPWTGTTSSSLKNMTATQIKQNTFAGGYQPNFYGKTTDKKGNITYNKLKKEVGSNGVAETFTHPYTGNVQYVWNNGKGKNVVWDTWSGKYYEVYKSGDEWLLGPTPAKQKQTVNTSGLSKQQIANPSGYGGGFSATSVGDQRFGGGGGF